jgi:glycosyltransferase involved in cell wall biosynthesis
MINLLAAIARPFCRAARPRIALLDDLFPLAGSRFEEFSSYLNEMPEIDVSAHCSGQSFHFAAESRSVEAVIAEHLAAHPRHVGRVRPLRPDEFPDADAYYMIFLHNAAQYLEEIERKRKPFAFTLYPGGGFGVNEEWSDDNLDRICSSPLLQRIIVTQPYTRDYIVTRHPRAISKICYVYGGIIPRSAFGTPNNRKHFGVDKKTLEIGFVAARYTPRGEDKGYDLFVETARALIRIGIDATYHVVGPWDPTVVPMQDIATRVVFHGFLDTEELRDIARNFDLILSPNKPSVLKKGAFDGFPTFSCVAAGLQEAAIFCSDVLKMNSDYRDNVDLVVVEPSVNDIVQRLLSYIQAPARLAQIGRNGRIRLIELFGHDKQMAPRFGLLRSMVRSLPV